MSFDLVHVVRFCTRELLERFNIESCKRGYQVCKGMWEASIVPYRRGNGRGTGLAFSFNIASAFFNHGIVNGIQVLQRAIVKVDLAPSLLDFVQHM